MSISTLNDLLLFSCLVALATRAALSASHGPGIICVGFAISRD